MKEGIEYMMLSVSMGSAWKLLIAEYGHKAISVLFLVHQMIYSEKGYYTEWNEDRALLLTLAGTNLTAEEIQEVIRGAIRRNVFDKSMYEEHGILTSEEVQNHYFQVVKRRKMYGKTYKYLLQSGSNPEVSLSGSTEEQEEEKEEETLLVSEEELANFAPMGENFSILPETTPAESVLVQNEAREKKEIDPKQVFLLYQKVCTNLEKVHAYNEARDLGCRDLLKTYSLPQIGVAFQAMNENPWNQGENSTHWVANFDYCINPMKVESYLSKAAYNRAAQKYRNTKVPKNPLITAKSDKKYDEIVE